MRIPVLVLVAAHLPALATAQGLVPFGAEFQVNSHTTGVQMYSTAGFGPEGTFIVFWGSQNSDDGRGGGIFGQLYDVSGAPIGTEFKVNSHTGFASRPEAVSDAQGRYTVVWGGRGEDGLSDIFARRYDVYGMPLDATDFRVNTYTTGTQQEPSVDVDAAGQTTIVWETATDANGQSGVYARPYDGDGQPTDGQFQVNTTTGVPHHHAKVASAAAGDFMVVWEVWASPYDVFSRSYSAASEALGPEAVVNTATSGTQFDASVAVDAAGTFQVVWAAGLYSWPYPTQVARRRYAPSGVPEGAQLRVNTITTGYGLAPWPSATFGPDGSYVVFWEWDHDGGGTDVVGRSYDAASNPGPEFRVNTNTAGNHGRPFVTSAADGEFLVTWTAFVGANSEIFARRYRTDLIFADGFESGSLSAWSSSATGGGDLTVSADASAKLTPNGLSGAVDDTAALYVQDASPRDEPRYRARFHFDTNGFDPGEADSHLRTRIFIAFEEAPTRRLAAIVLRRQGGAYSLIGRARLDDGAQANTTPIPIADGSHFVEIDWRRSSGPDANDGAFEMWIEGTLAATLSNLDNSLSAVDFVRLGALSVKSGASGTMYWDEFESRRGSYIGP
jgi:hypothetical protein